jgi:SOS-response transcriptional repressor LexA
MSTSPTAPSVASVATLRAGEYLVLDLVIPGQKPQSIGIILLDKAADTAHVRFRRDWDALLEDWESHQPTGEDFRVDTADMKEILSALETDLEAWAQQGGEALLTHLDQLSNTLRVGDRERVTMANPERTLADLYRRHVASTVQPFRTHLPLYAARAAATKFSEQQSVPGSIDDAAWVEVPPGVNLREGMFIARVEGRSMEGGKVNIPSGSLCIFRDIKGSRQGKLVLIENRSGRKGEAERYTIKQYWSEKTQSPDGWTHERILLKPLNPEFDAWTLDESGDYAVLGEFVTVLD